MSDSAFTRVPSVLIAPERTFASIARKPSWLIAMLALVAAGVLAVSVTIGKVDFETAMRERLQESRVQLSEEQIEQQSAFMGRFGKAFAYGGAIVAPWVMYPIVAGLFLLVLRLLGGTLDFARSMSVSVHAMMPLAVAALLLVPIAMGRGDIGLTELENGTLLPSNLLALLGSGFSPPLRAALQSVDFFSLWTLVLLAIGYHTVAGVSRARAAGAVLGLWSLWVCVRVGFAALGQMFGA